MCENNVFLHFLRNKGSSLLYLFLVKQNIPLVLVKLGSIFEGFLVSTFLNFTENILDSLVDI
ncbi:MAG: hypothetical protein RL242_3495 [Pseudomonadota bacterium]